MKEKIYTIPVTDAFATDCECPLCVLEQKLEDDALEYTLGPAMMEPDFRTETNKKGFCKNHFSLLYQMKNRLGLALVIDTHLTETNKQLSDCFSQKMDSLKSDSQTNAAGNLFNKFLSKSSDSEGIADSLIQLINNVENQCTICDRITSTMERYIDVILYLWDKEQDFRETFKSCKGFCLPHMKQLLNGGKKHLDTKKLALFLIDVLPLEMNNLQRMQGDINWFTQKFDYRHQDAPWKNSKDAVPRSIEKIAGFCRLEK